MIHIVQIGKNFVKIVYNGIMKKKYRSEFDSRQNMIRENYEVYYYSDSHFQSVSLHKHDYYEFYFPVSGRIEMEIEGKRTPLGSRDVVIVPPGTIHRAVTENSERSYCRYVFWVSAEYFRQICREMLSPLLLEKEAKEKGKYIHHFSGSEYALIQARLLRLVEEDKASHYGREEMIDLCIRDLLLTLSRLIYEHDHREDPDPESGVSEALMAYIQANLDDDLSLEKLGEQFSISKYHIAHIFKEETGVSVHRYILKKRLECCANDIKIGKPISKIIREYGFSDYSSFFRAFRKEYHLSPREYRQVYLGDPLLQKERSSQRTV